MDHSHIALVRSRSAFLIRAFGLFLFGAVAAVQPFAQSLPDTLDNNRIIELVRAGFTDTVLIPKIRQSRVLLDISAEALVAMKAAGVSDDVIVALMDRARSNGFVSEGPIESYTVIPYGAEVTVTNKEKLTSKNLKPGQKLVLEIAQDLNVNGKLVIAKGTPVAASVVDSRKSGMLGRSGRLAIYIESTRLINGELIRIRAGKSGKDGDNMRSMFALTVVLGAPGLLMKGTNGQIPANSIITAQVDETRYVKLP